MLHRIASRHAAPLAFAVLTAAFASMLPPYARADDLDEAVRAVEQATDAELLDELQRRRDELRDAAKAAGEGLTGRDVQTGLRRLDDQTLAKAVRVVEGNGRVIYGPDDRKDWHEIEDEAVKRLASASVALFAAVQLEAEGAGALKLKTAPLGERADLLGKGETLCPEERFAKQATGAFCSGTLVKEDMVLTAGHCVREISANGNLPYITAVSFVFGYRVEQPGSPGTTSIARQQVFKGRQVEGGELSGGRGRDWALVRLEHPVPAALAAPVTRWRSAAPTQGQGVFVIGYPSGLPLKYAPGASVRDTSDPAYFVANLDTFGGNSGSGVYDTATGELAGVLVRGETDYVRYKGEACVRAYACPTSGCRGEDVTRIAIVPKP